MTSSDESKQNIILKEEGMMKSSCPVCKKKFRNVLLHIDKKSKCKEKVLKEEYCQLKEKSDETKRTKNRKAMAKRRERLRLEDHEALKKAQNEWKYFEWRGCEKIRRECNNYDKEKSRKKAREDDPEKVKADQRRWKRLSRNKKRESDKKIIKESTLKVDELPDKCPVCGKVTKSILIHINQKESCKASINSEVYNGWKILARKRSKRKYQDYYVKKGDHSEAQARYMKESFETDRLSSLQTERHKKGRYLSRYRIENADDIKKLGLDKREPDFRRLALSCFWRLGHGEVPSEEELLKFHLVESETEMDNDEVHDWLKYVNTSHLKMVITFQQLILIPKSKWLSIIDKVKNESKTDFQERIFKMIGRLQEYGNENTKKIDIPAEYKSKIKLSDTVKKKIEWYNSLGWSKGYLKKEDEEIFEDLVLDIIGDKKLITDEKFQDLLRIKKNLENLKYACMYTK